MPDTTTRGERADRRPTMSFAVAAAITVSLVHLCSTPAVLAQVTTAGKQHPKVQRKTPAPTPTDGQADQLNEKWLSEYNKADQPAPDGTANGAALKTPSPALDDERVSSVPSMATLPGAATRVVVPGSLKMMRADNVAVAFKSAPGGANQPIFKDLIQAFAGFTPTRAKVEMAQGRTADGSLRLLYASIGEGKARQSYWWFSPVDQPEGWFDENGQRLGGTALAQPKPDSRISSPFGTRRYYGRRTGNAFHNGIDFEGKVGEPIQAAADGVINHQGWYFNYGRTVKISHADNFETLYAHMSRFADGVGPGSTVHKGDIIGYVGSTGRSTGPHLHFSAIVDGQFVDPEPYLSGNAGHGSLSGGSLVAFRKWQQDVHAAVKMQKTESEREHFRLVQGNDAWNRNPFTQR